jgi:putative alpha-1,2-mannosidase
MGDLTQYVLPFVGSEGGGNVFPGVTRPYGMVKLGPDLVVDQVNAYAGYLSEGDFAGFSMMHLSGTGGVPMYGVVSQLPIVGEIPNPLDVRVGRAAPDVAEVGYYGARTSEDVFVELAATEHAAMFQYTFPGDEGNIVVDVSHRLSSFRGFGLEQQFEGGNMTINADGQYEGSATYSNGYNMAPSWTIYFCMPHLRFPTVLLLLIAFQVDSLIRLPLEAESSRAR